ncbi:hypothetical protein PENSPDRAFT_647846 [Peniophora sp. CONT]|nr:hypothetical protein PENSPDRAFT_647846 [Peniophora sp. CONT]
MPIRDNRIDTRGNARRTTRGEYFNLTEPFILPVPVHDQSQSPPRKGQRRSQQRVALLRDYLDNSPSSSPTNPFLDPPISHWNAQTTPVNGDSDAQQALERSLILERRLDDLMHTLANRGETESIPPDYEGNVAHRASGRDERDV